MHMYNEIATDAFAQKKNLITEIDARIKIVFVVIALIINLISVNIWASVGISCLCFITLLLVRIPPRLILLRLAMPLVMAVVVLITQIFLYGTTPLFIIDMHWWHLTGYEEGLARGILILWRVIAGISLVLFLSLTTPAYKLFQAASWFKLPGTFIELILLTYRYIFVLLDEVITIRDAQKTRLGYYGWRKSMKSLSVLGGTLLLRSYDRAERVFEAMLVRGYTGTHSIRYYDKLYRTDYLVIASLAVILSFLYFLGQWQI
jgi:cobalt/nickel transport system permease protein